jgi:hypothetical protein
MKVDKLADPFKLVAEIGYFTSAGRSQISFNEPIILPENLNANSSVDDYFDIKIKEDISGKDITDKYINTVVFEGIYS